MKIGTKSVLFGAHAFWLHPFFVALGWWKLYGFPWDPRLWVAFFVHDLGYWRMPDMDGEEGEKHPLWGAELAAGFCDGITVTDEGPVRRLMERGFSSFCAHFWGKSPPWYWAFFVRDHSRFLAKRNGVSPSRLCMADKLAVALEPWWLYLPRVIASGEIREYMALSRDRNAKYGRERRRERDFRSRREWCERMQDHCRNWALEHKDGRPDTWTPEAG